MDKLPENEQPLYILAQPNPERKKHGSGLDTIDYFFFSN